MKKGSQTYHSPANSPETAEACPTPFISAFSSSSRTINRTSSNSGLLEREHVLIKSCLRSSNVSPAKLESGSPTSDGSECNRDEGKRVLVLGFENAHVGEVASVKKRNLESTCDFIVS